MATQVPSSSSSSVVITVTVEGAQLDIKAASEEQPQALRTELIKALRFIALSPPDLALIHLQEKFRVSLNGARSKTPDRLAAVVYSCRKATFDETLWEAQAWYHGGRQLVNTIYNIISSIPIDSKQSSDTTKTLQLLKAGGQPTVTAFHLMNCPASLEHFEKVRDKFITYGGTLALAACAVAISNDIKVKALLERLLPSHWTALISHIFGVRLHSDLVCIVQRIFASKEHPQTKRCRIGPAPRKSKTRDRERADTARQENDRPRKRKTSICSTEHINDTEYQHKPAQVSSTARRENPEQLAAAMHAPSSYLRISGNMEISGRFDTRIGPVGYGSDDGMALLGVPFLYIPTGLQKLGNYRVDLDMDMFLNDPFEYHAINLDDLDLSTPSL
ncbi:hypothetical protein B0T17DRAFT_510932 [Bombardia bombarda]|uniref:Uncharacterized protein n=1 Tax=Bombardia bombarda TaxID=252184 RepID=A0AA39WGU3_9PEZI|nr:hypothetical protein B0T17DRAFT_510932 [Bombardia bombarda]